MDCEMPYLTGLEACSKIRDIEMQTGTNSPVTVIGVSGNEGEQHKRMCKLHGMDDSITKPIKIH